MARTGGVTGRPEALAAAKVPGLPRGDVVVALSGGPDSAVAAWLVTKAGSPGARAVFVDHGWEHSATMAAAARAVAARLRLRLTIVAIDAGRSETEAREARLRALVEAAAGAPIITGHHAGDVAETVLLNLLRGAGAAGLSGIPALRRPFVRPLVDVPAREVRLVAEELGLPFVEDPANLDTAHRRTMVRHQLLPQMEALAPGVGAGLVKAAGLLRADDVVLEGRADRVRILSGAGWRSIPCGALSTLPEPVASRVVRRALRGLHPPYPGESRDVGLVLGAIRGPGADLSGRLRCEREGPFVTVFDPAEAPGPIACESLVVPGSVAAPVACVAAGAEPIPPVRRMGRNEAWLDEGLAGELVVRSAEAGERIAIDGGSKLVRDAMAEGGVPLRLRRGWPVVAARGKIAWIAGVRAAVWTRPARDARAAIRLTIERL